MSRSQLVVVGDALLDRDVDGTVERLSPDAPVAVLDERTSATRPGGAGLAAALAAADGSAVTLVTALGDDPAGHEVRRLLEQVGVELIACRLVGDTPEKIRLRTGSQPLLRLDRGGPPAPLGSLPAVALDAIVGAGVVVVSDYGRHFTSQPELRAVLSRRRHPTVWDPHPRGAAPVSNLALVTPNLAELRSSRLGAITEHPDDLPRGTTGSDHLRAGSLRSVTDLSERARRAWGARAVVTTLGAKGALLVTEDGPALAVPGLPVTTGDPCGAGDRFVTTVANRLSAGALVTEAVIDAVEEAGRFVGGGGAASYPSVPRSTTAVTISRDLPNQGKRHVDGRVGSTSPTGVVELADHMRAARGTVVVAGGCFDLLHAGHLSLLEGARRLGDCLIVAMNSDRSVRRLKGEGRPVVPEADRAALLAALGCVDAVAIFDEDSPIELLHRLRPQIFVKGGDYSARELPEDSVVRRWGGQAVVLPYLSGRSTTRLLQTANVRP